MKTDMFTVRLLYYHIYGKLRFWNITYEVGKDETERSQDKNNFQSLYYLYNYY